MSIARRLLRDWSARRAARAGAVAAVKQAFQEPDEADVAWMAGLVPGGDADHARWELRYARRSMLMLSARRDALDDLTPSLVAAALDDQLSADPASDETLRALSLRQFNVRLKAYGDALGFRGPERGTAALGRLLLSFFSIDDADAAAVARAEQLVHGYLDEANASLRRFFGTASLPTDVVPSLAQEHRRTT